jgi:hypothetical protein
MAGHSVTLVCTKPTADLIRREGTRVRLPIRGREAPIAISSKELKGALSACPPDAADPSEFDLVVLGMQEPQYGSDGVRELMGRAGAARVPCLAIMNIPPLPYLERVPGVSTSDLKGCYTDAAVWESFEPGLVTLSSPDPQAVRPPDEPKNVLQVGLATNFKAARFEAEAPTEMLRRLEGDIERVRFDPGDGEIEVPVKLKVHDSVFVPLSKWPMLLAGNYRCIGRDDMISIRDAVHGNPEVSREIYDWVRGLCLRLGASEEDLVPFEKYAAAADALRKPSSAARALFGGAPAIERVDCLVRRIAAQQGLRSDALDGIVDLVDRRLAKNRVVTGTTPPAP